jgi:hypothetical protein
MIWMILAGITAFICLAPSVLAACVFWKLWLINPKACARYMVFCPIAIGGKMATWVLALPVATLSVIAGWDELPTGLRWMQTHDDGLEGLGNGWPPVSGFFAKIWRRTIWLWRNPAYTLLYRMGAAEGTDIILPGPDWISGKGLQRRYTANAVSVRGQLKFLYIYLGWKLVQDFKERNMLALNIQIRNIAREAK